MVDWRLDLKATACGEGLAHSISLDDQYRDVSAALSNQQNPAPVYGAHTHTSVFVLWMCKPKECRGEGHETVKAVNVIKR